MSIITSSVGFVRLGILIPKPNSQTVHDLCALAPGVIGYPSIYFILFFFFFIPTFLLFFFLLSSLFFLVE